MNLNARLKNIAFAIRNRFRRGIKTRDAIGISILLHLLIGTAFASFLVGTYYVTPSHPEQSIEFDLIAETVKPTAADRLAGQVSDQTAGGAQSNSATGSAPQTIDKQAILMASLGSLSDLKESFKFVMQQVSSDSLGLSPLHGQMPSTAFYGAGSGGEDGSGHGGISIGVCAPGPRY